MLANFLLGITVGFVCTMLGSKSALYVGLGLLVLAVLLPSLAAQVRRLHDTNASGWWILLSFIPYIGGLIMAVWYCFEGTAGENRFGPDPLDPHSLAAFD